MRKLWMGTAALLIVGLVSGASAETIELKDPKGDDKGPGNYTYPTDPVYKRGSFDLVSVKIQDKGSKVAVTMTVNARIEDPWGSKKWDGNGFSVQMGFLFIDKDHKAGSGHQKALPGLNVRFAKESYWDKVLIISPQGKRRLSAEVNAKAGNAKGDVVIPTNVKVKGKSITATYKKSDIGGDISAKWGFQFIMQSNEGYPSKSDLLTRKVNEFRGKHRFGGGSDYDCDPHVIDMLAGSATGAASERAAQYKALKGYVCDEEGDEAKSKQATIGMVYPAN